MKSYLIEHVQAPVIVGGFTVVGISRVGRVEIISTGHVYAAIVIALATRCYRHEQDVRCESSQQRPAHEASPVHHL